MAEWFGKSEISSWISKNASNGYLEATELAHLRFLQKESEQIFCKKYFSGCAGYNEIADKDLTVLFYKNDPRHLKLIEHLTVALPFIKISMYDQKIGLNLRTPQKPEEAQETYNN